MRHEDIEKIRNLSIFKNASEDVFQRLTSVSFLQRFPAGVVLLQENTTTDFLYILVDGKVEMFSQAYGREITLGVVEPVNFFILAAVLTNKVCLQSARTMTDAQLLMIPASLINATVREDPTFATAVIDELATNYRSMVKELKDQKLLSSTERLANWILRRSQLSDTPHYVEITFEKKILASYLGMTAENLSRAFSKLTHHGIKIDGSRVIITDREKLTNFFKVIP